MKANNGIKKIIHINCHTIPLKDDYIFGSFPSRMARNVKKYSNRYKNECWYAINNIKKEKVWQKDGITYRLFPVFTLNKLLESFFGIIYSKTLINALNKEKKREDIIYHIQGERGLLVWQILNIVKEKPIIMQFHGYRGFWFIRPIEKWIVELGEKYLYKNVNYFLVHFKARIKYLTKSCFIPKEKIVFQNLGVDYEIFKPSNKKKLRKELKLPENKKIILHVGGGYKNKGIEKIIKAHQMIKNKYNTFLILIGVLKNDPLYKQCKNESDLLIERVPHQKMPKYFNAADVCCMICPKDKKRYGGLGIAAMEAMACNIPIINSNIDDAPDEIKNKIGLGATNEFDLASGLIKIFEKKVVFKDIRKISEKYFSWKEIILRILKMYESFDKGKA